MTIYSLGDKAPQIDPDTWVAPDANVIGDVVLERAPRFGFPPHCAATTNGSPSGQGATFKKTRSCILISGFL